MSGRPGPTRTRCTLTVAATGPAPYASVAFRLLVDVPALVSPRPAITVAFIPPKDGVV
jgi:hypothetical protein